MEDTHARTREVIHRQNGCFLRGSEWQSAETSGESFLYPFPLTCVHFTLRSGLQGCPCVLITLRPPTPSRSTPDYVYVFPVSITISMCASSYLPRASTQGISLSRCRDGDGISAGEEMRLRINEVGGRRGKVGENVVVGGVNICHGEWEGFTGDGDGWGVSLDADAEAGRRGLSRSMAMWRDCGSAVTYRL